MRRALRWYSNLLIEFVDWFGCLVHVTFVNWLWFFLVNWIRWCVHAKWYVLQTIIYVSPTRHCVFNTQQMSHWNHNGKMAKISIQLTFKSATLIPIAVSILINQRLMIDWYRLHNSNFIQIRFNSLCTFYLTLRYFAWLRVQMLVFASRCALCNVHQSSEQLVTLRCGLHLHISDITWFRRNPCGFLRKI